MSCRALILFPANEGFGPDFEDVSATYHGVSIEPGTRYFLCTGRGREARLWADKHAKNPNVYVLMYCDDPKEVAERFAWWRDFCRCTDSVTARYSKRTSNQ